MAGSLMASDPWQWLAVNEERLLLHDGLTVMSDNIAVPSGVTEMREEDSGLPVLDGKTPEDLARIIRKECSTKTTSYASLMEYRLNALKGLWRALKDFEESHANSVSKEISSSSSSQASSGHTVSFASRVSLVLIFPLIKSLSKLDPTLSSETASILLETLRACEPLSLSGEPPDCISGLENLLCSWLHSVQENSEEVPLNQVHNAASALVALAVAVGTGSLLLRTVHLLETLKVTYPDLRLLVPGILYKLLHEHMTQEGVSGLTADTHILCWGYNDGLVQDGKEGTGPRSIAFDGKYIFVTSSSLKYLLKLGSGKKGTIKGLVYASAELGPGWVVYVDGRLIHRKLIAEGEVFCRVIDRDTLKISSQVFLESEPADVLQTFQLLSDGKHLYWLHALQTQDTITHPVTGEKIKQHPVILQTLHFKSSDRGFEISLGRKVLIKRLGPESDKNSEMVKVLVRASPSYSSSALSSLLGISKDDTSGITSCGLTVRMLQKCAAYTTGSSLVLLTAPPTSGGRGNLFGVQGGQASKALCLNLCFSMFSGKSVSHPDLQPSSQLHCALSKGASMSTMAACYISSHHCVWTCNDDWIDVWDCAGKVRIAPHQLATRLGKASIEELVPPSPPQSGVDAISVSEAISLMLRHIGMESCRLVPEFSTTVVHSLPLIFLDQCSQLLECSVRDELWSNAQAVIITLQAVLPSFLNSQRIPVAKVIPLRNKVRGLIWQLLTATPLDSSHPLLVEVRRIVSQNCEALFLNHENRVEFLTTLLEADDASTLCLLKEEVLVEIASDLQYCSTLSPAIASVSQLVRANIQTESVQLIQKCFKCSTEELPALISCSPVFPPTLLCGAILLNVTLRKCVLSLQRKGEESTKSPTDSSTEDSNQAAVLEMCQQLDLFKACEVTLQELCGLLSGPPLDSTEEQHPQVAQFPSPDEGSGDQSEAPPTLTPSPRQLRVQAIEKGARSSVLGCVLQPLLAVVSDPSVCSLQMANTIQRNLSRLAELSAQACCLLYGSNSEDLGHLKVPAPWATGRTVETIHPVRDNYKFKETVAFPGANNLYLKFDPRCSSQYDYDKVQVYAGDSTSGNKVAEYGGNTHGFGSRSVLGKGWPKDLVKVEGDSVTFSFEMKSGREHSTPDRAMWGFSCTVRPQESADTSPMGLPFLTDLYLSLASVCCSLIGRLYSGPPISPEEEQCQELLNSNLLQCCVWSQDEGTPDMLPLHEDHFPLTSPSSHAPLPMKVIEQLRGLAGKPQPTLRPSTQELLQAHLLEDVIVSVCLKQHGAESALHILGQEPGTAEMDMWRELLELVFGRINGLERRLQLLAELESSWWNDVDDIVSGTLPPSEAFFLNLLHQEGSLKNLELLCCLKGVILNKNDVLSTTRQLQDQMEMDVERKRTASTQEEAATAGVCRDTTPVTRGLVKGVMDRANLLLSVTIAHQHQQQQQQQQQHGLNVSMSHEDAPISPVTSPIAMYSRSISSPPSTVEPSGIRRTRSWTSRGKQSLLDVPTTADKSNLLDQIFQFIGSKPEKAVVCSSFLKAARQQWRRGVCRVRALGYLHQLLTSEYVKLFIKQLLASVGGVLQQGPGFRSVACGGMAEKVREAFASVMHAVVELASKQPAACIDTISMLCIVPFTRLEEQCLVRSGLVKLLDQLCSLMDEQKPVEDEDESLHRVTSLAWAAFQVLADHCVSWESQDSAVLSSGLAQQVSNLLTNHLSRAMDRLVVSESGASEGLQDALSLLLGLARSHLGRAILSQPGCISKLLLLLTDQRPSPKLVLIALQLCRIALPLMTVAECSLVVVPSNPSMSHSSHRSGKSLAADIVGLLLAKLAEYIVPDASQVSHKHLSEDSSPLEEQMIHTPLLHHDSIFESENGQASVYLYKREDESAAEILQPLISQDPRHFRLSGHRMQEVMQIDHALTEHGKAELVTDSYRACVRRAVRWATMGFTVSVEPPSEGAAGEPPGNVVDKKKAHSENSAKKKNQELLKTDPPRPFLSGHVAYSLASEVIRLLHGLLTEPGAAEVWGTAIKDSLLQSLMSIPTLIPLLASYTLEVHSNVATGSPPSQPDQLLQAACIANATFAALGGFRESIRAGMQVQIVGGPMEECYGTIQSLAERKGMAIVQMEDDPLCFGADKTLELPLSRLVPPKQDTLLPLRKLKVGPELCQAICSVLSSCAPSLTHAHSSSDANTSPLGLCRLFAELRTRACMCLAHHIKDPSIAQLFLSQPLGPDQPSFQELLSQEAKRSSCGLRVSLVESYCQSLRMLYRDCARPPPPRVTHTYSKPKLIQLDLKRPWPPVVACCFTHNLCSITYQGSTNLPQPSTSGPANGNQDTNSSKPKGVIVYANSAIPSQAPSFYWELEVSHLGESSADAAHVAMGYSPSPQEPAEPLPWTYPIDTVLIRSSGRVCQVNSENLMEWNTFRLSGPIKSGDVVGCGWVRGEEGNKGTAYFTLNGEKFDDVFTDVPGEMLPFVFLQKKSTKVQVNFGSHPFKYAEGHVHREAADVVEQEESCEEILALFAVLPFANEWESDVEEEQQEGEGPRGEGDEGVVVELSQTGPPTRKLKSPIVTIGYDHEASQGYQMTKSFESMLESGPLIRPGGVVQEEEEEVEGTSFPPEEDLHALLVKAWEVKVFPVIQKRFRNDHERKSGLEQIKGALQLGMESIAQETVEFLYEENGGIPRDLHLPTMDDVKADLGKFTISHVKKGSVVVVQKELPYSRCGGRTLQKTEGLTGIVLDVDEASEIVQVETYLQNEGALVGFWYPVVYLERPPAGYRKSSSLRGGDAANMLVHRQLLRCEASLVSMYSRRALLILHKSLERSKGEELVENLKLISQECFAEPLTEGPTTTTNPDLAPSPSAALQPLQLSPIPIFYSEPDCLQQELLTVLETESLRLISLTQRLCQCLLKTPDEFGSTELKVTESKEVIDIAHPEAAFILLSCADDRTAVTKPLSSIYKYPWARVMCYQGGQGKAGRQQIQEVARYPNLMVQSINQQYCGPVYPSLVLPCNRIHLKLGGCSTKPGKVLNVLALPEEFPLALSFAHCLSQVATKRLSTSSTSSASQRQVTFALSVCLRSLSKFLNRIDCLIPLKEVVLHQLSDIMWTLCSHVDPAKLQSRPWTGEGPQQVSSEEATGAQCRHQPGEKEEKEEELTLYTIPSKFLQSAQQELLKLYESECGKFSKSKSGDSKHAFPAVGGIGAGGLGRFSTYFQALLEFVLATLDYQHKFHGTAAASVPSSVSSSATLISSSNPNVSNSSIGHGGSTSSTTSTCASGNVDSASGASGSSTSISSDSQQPLNVTSSSDQVGATALVSGVNSSRSDFSPGTAAPVVATPTDPTAGKKLAKRTRSRKGLLKKESSESAPKKDEWLNVVHQSATLLRAIASHNLDPTSCVPIQQLQKASNTPHPSSRLVVLLGLSSNLTLEAAELAIRRVCKLYGGLYKEELYLPSSSSDPLQHCGHAVLELCCGAHTSVACSALLAAPSLQQEGENMQALSVTNSLSCGQQETEAKKVLMGFLRWRLGGGQGVNSAAVAAISDIFNSSCSESVSTLTMSQVSSCLLKFFRTFAGICTVSTDNFMGGLWEEFADQNGLLDVEGFKKCMEQDFLLDDEFSMRGVWLGLIECGYDLHLERFPSELPPDVSSSALSPAQDQVLVAYVDSLCRHLSVTASSLQPWDLFLSEAEITNQQLSSLQGLSLLDIRFRFSQLKLINQQLALLLPLVDLRSTHPLSLGQLLSSVSPLLFYDVKISFFHSVLNASTRRSLDQAPPEIKMDPLESVSGVAMVPLKTQFCQAAQQMLSVPSPQLCVSLASGGDPMYAFNVKLSGEEVHGTSGSFRHFLWQVVRELQSSVLPLLLPCPSGSVGVNHGKYILAPGPISYSEEKLLQFFGQLLGVAIRADVPITIDFLPCFWKSLKSEPLSLADLKEADCVTYNLTCKILSAESTQEFQEVVCTLRHIGGGSGEDAEFPVQGAQKRLTFVYTSLNGLDVELIPGGREIDVDYSNRREYVEALRRFRIEELACPLLMNAVRCGIASVIPLQLLSLLTADNLSLRVCGLPTIDLEYLKRHTMYQVGLMESDRHIQFFWNALESFSQDELRKFIKFACNQERIPFGLSCRDGGRDSETHVPPYPMKIAPPDGRGPPDDRYIRAETCMFMVKLPQYSSQQIMTERLKYAVYCREDPLSG